MGCTSLNQSPRKIYYNSWVPARSSSCGLSSLVYIYPCAWTVASVGGECGVERLVY